MPVIPLKPNDPLGLLLIANEQEFIHASDIPEADLNAVVIDLQNRGIHTPQIVLGQFRGKILLAPFDFPLNKLSMCRVLIDWPSLSVDEVLHMVREGITGEAEQIDEMIQFAEEYFEEHGYPQSIEGIDDIPEPTTPSTPL